MQQVSFRQAKCHVWIRTCTNHISFTIFPSVYTANARSIKQLDQQRFKSFLINQSQANLSFSFPNNVNWTTDELQSASTIKITESRTVICKHQRVIRNFQASTPQEYEVYCHCKATPRLTQDVKIFQSAPIGIVLVWQPYLFGWKGRAYTNIEILVYIKLTGEKWRFFLYYETCTPQFIR